MWVSRVSSQSLRLGRWLSPRSIPEHFFLNCRVLKSVVCDLVGVFQKGAKMELPQGGGHAIRQCLCMFRKGHRLLPWLRFGLYFGVVFVSMFYTTLQKHDLCYHWGIGISTSPQKLKLMHIVCNVIHMYICVCFYALSAVSMFLSSISLRFEAIPLSPFAFLPPRRVKGERGIVSNLNEIDDNNIETALNAVDHLQMILTCFGRL